MHAKQGFAVNQSDLNRLSYLKRGPVVGDDNPNIFDADEDGEDHPGNEKALASL